MLPSNSPGVHTLWLPAIPLQLGLVLKPGPQEPWTPYRMIRRLHRRPGFRPKCSAFTRVARKRAPRCFGSAQRAMIFGGTATVEQYKGNPRVQAHGPGFSKILLGDDVVDDWEKYIDLMAESIYINSGRGCINCSGDLGLAAHQGDRPGPGRRNSGRSKSSRRRIRRPAWPRSRFTGQAKAVWGMIEADLKESGRDRLDSAKYGTRLDEKERCAYLAADDRALRCPPKTRSPRRNTCSRSPRSCECPQDQMLAKIGPTLVGTAITNDEKLIEQLRRTPRTSIG